MTLQERKGSELLGKGLHTLSRRVSNIERRVGAKPIQAAVAAAAAAATTGAGPWPYDYLVSLNYTGAAGAIQTAFGHTYRVFATVQGAITNGFTTFASRAFSIFVVPGTYPEALTIHSLGYLHEVYIYGAGRDVTIIGGNTLSHRIGNLEVFFEHLTVTGSVGQKAFTQMAATANMRVHCRDVIFRRPMAGDHAGSQFYDCVFEEGWIPEALDSPETVTLVDCITFQNFDFQASNISIDQWHFIAFRLESSTALLKFYALSDCFVEMIGGTGLANQLAIDVENSIRSTTIMGIFKSPGFGTVVMNFVLADGGIQHDGVKIIATFNISSGAPSAANRLIKTSGPGVARGWHIDVTETRDGLGQFLEDQPGGAVSIEMANAEGCKFTLAPHDKMKILISAGVNNVLDSGVLV